jgi:hypothetical protein
LQIFLWLRNTNTSTTTLPGVPGFGGVLPPFHQELRCHRRTTDDVAQEGRVQVERGGGRGILGTSVHAHHGANPTTPKLLPRLCCGMRRLRHGLGTVLHQGGGPVAFFSRQLASWHTKLFVYERELIGLVQAVWHWRPYLWGRPFLIKTDHFSLKFLLDQRLATILQLSLKFHLDQRLSTIPQHQ